MSSKISVSVKVSKMGPEILINWGDESEGIPRNTSALESDTNKYCEQLREIVFKQHDLLMAEWNVRNTFKAPVQPQQPILNNAPFCSDHGVPMVMNKAGTYFNCPEAKWVKGPDGKNVNMGCKKYEKVK